MCFELEQLNHTPSPTVPLISPHKESLQISAKMNHLTIETTDNFGSLLELAANNDVKDFKQSLERNPSCVDEVGLWNGRKKGSKHMVNEHRTPLMVVAAYGSIDVIKLIFSQTDADVNRCCGLDKSTALHCAASPKKEPVAPPLFCCSSSSMRRISRSAPPSCEEEQISLPKKI